MALPVQLKSARLDDNSVGATIDNAIGDVEKMLADLFGAPLDTNIANKLFDVLAAGLTAIYFQSSANPTVAGSVRRIANVLKFHDGTTVQEFAFLNQPVFSSASNAFGIRRIQTSVPADADYANGDITIVVDP